MDENNLVDNPIYYNDERLKNAPGEIKVIYIPTLCKYCQFFDTPKDYGRRGDVECFSPEAPITDFINGIKIAHKININGECPYYKDRRRTGVVTSG